ncbi:MAG TPA: ribosomal RNA small subunit methyltransferase A [Clostridiales bacterium]|nr:ribosomal RNA small subunit methyltransferase A [Clostridiales bacterium]
MRHQGTPPVWSVSYVSGLVRSGAVRPKRGLGQNFLVDVNVLERTVEALGEVRGRTVLEIGAGLGGLTAALAQAGAGRVVAVEKDRSLIPHLLANTRAWAAVEVVAGDALALDLRGLAGGEALVAGNLPYRVTTPLLLKLLEPPLFWPRAVVMVQFEVAQRILAEPGEKAYGALTLAVAAVSRPALARRVGRNSFYPRPEVDSALVVLDRLPRPAGGLGPEGLARLSRLVRAAFGQRRKTLVNALAGGLGLDRGAVEQAVRQAGIDGGRRGETLSMEEFQALERAFRGLVGGADGVDGSGRGRSGPLL